MSIPLDRLYFYIESVAQDVRGSDVIIYHFYPHGSKNIEDLNALRPYTFFPTATNPHIICHDQEPLNYELYQGIPIRIDLSAMGLDDDSMLPQRNLRVMAGSAYDKCILIHSEKNGINLEKYRNDQFIPVYYWSHAIISRDWFRYSQYCTTKKDVKQDFLIYNRSWSGSREYRIKFTDMLIDSNLLKHCRTFFNPYDQNTFYLDHEFQNLDWKPNNKLEDLVNPTVATSCYSADFNIDDYNETNFEVILETLFDDDRIHLTEKTLRSIACKQPFILAAPAGSLKYLQSYGFKTFSDIIDENYDTIQEPKLRMEAIIKLMEQISSWPDDEKQKKLVKLNEIAEYNRDHFFSDTFFNQVVEELKTNLKLAFEEIEINSGVGPRDPITNSFPKIKEFRRNLPRSEYLQVLAILRKYRHAWRKQQRQ